MNASRGCVTHSIRAQSPAPAPSPPLGSHLGVGSSTPGCGFPSCVTFRNTRTIPKPRLLFILCFTLTSPAVWIQLLCPFVPFLDMGLGEFLVGSVPMEEKVFVSSLLCSVELTWCPPPS